MHAGLFQTYTHLHAVLTMQLMHLQPSPEKYNCIDLDIKSSPERSVRIDVLLWWHLLDNMHITTNKHLQLKIAVSFLYSSCGKLIKDAMGGGQCEGCELNTLIFLTRRGPAFHWDVIHAAARDSKQDVPLFKWESLHFGSNCSGISSVLVAGAL